MTVSDDGPVAVPRGWRRAVHQERYTHVAAYGEVESYADYSAALLNTDGVTAIGVVAVDTTRALIEQAEQRGRLLERAEIIEALNSWTAHNKNGDSFAHQLLHTAIDEVFRQIIVQLKARKP